MFKFFSHWYQRRFSDPHAIGLMVWLLFGVIVIYFFGNLLAPLLVAIVLAYLLEWPVSYFCRLGIPRWLSVAGVLSSFISFMLMAFISLLPAIWEQISNLINDIPNMYTEAQTFLAL